MQPRITPTDIWNEIPCLDQWQIAPLHALPSKQAPKPCKERAMPPEDVPLRIDPFSLTDEIDKATSAAELEVFEINACVLRLTGEKPPENMVTKPVIFHLTGPLAANASDGTGCGGMQGQSMWWLCAAGAVVAAMMVGAMMLLQRVNHANAIHARPSGIEWVIDVDMPDEQTQQISGIWQRLPEAEELMDSYTDYGTADFPALVMGRGDADEILGWIAPDNFHTHLFPESEYRSYRFLSADEKAMLWVYAGKNEEIAATLDRTLSDGQILRGESRPIKATLRLAPPPEGALPNQWLLAELLHKEWIGP